VNVPIKKRVKGVYNEMEGESVTNHEKKNLGLEACGIFKLGVHIMESKKQRG